MSWAYNIPDGTPNKGPQIAAIILFLASLSLLFVLLRLYVRMRLIKAMGADDWVIMVAWFGTCVYTATTVVQTKYGLGLTKPENMPPENVYTFGLAQFVGAPFYVLAIWGFKISLLLSYMRFMTGAYRIASIVAAIVITMGHIAFVCVFIFLCTPINAQWDPDVTGHCAKAVPFYLSFSSLTIFFDIGVILLPFPVLLKAKIQRRKKVVLLGLFALGLFVTIIQVIRIQTITNLSNYLNSSMAILWSLVESNIGIIITCVPTLSPLVRYFNDRSSRGASTGASGSHKPDSRYALQTWRSNKSGMHVLGSGADGEFESHADGTRNDSTEGILSPTGITKTTDVTVERHQLPPNGDNPP